mgnify:FL=1
MKNTLLKRTQGPLHIHVYTEIDEDPDLSYLQQNYKEDSPKDRQRYLAQDKARLDAYYRGDWHYVGVCCDIRIKTETNWTIPTVIGRSSVWGVESDSGEDYFKDLAEDQIAEAFADIERMKKALATI